MLNNKLSQHVKRVLYHHRTQGKAVEGVHIRGITDALRADGVAVDIISLPGADPYVSPKAMSPTQQATGLMKLVSKFPEPLFELAELAYNALSFWRVGRYLSQNKDVGFIYERYSLFMFATVLLARWKKLPIILEVNDSATVVRVRPLFFLRLATLIERWVFRRAETGCKKRTAPSRPPSSRRMRPILPNSATRLSKGLPPGKSGALRGMWCVATWVPLCRGMRLTNLFTAWQTI